MRANGSAWMRRTGRPWTVLLIACALVLAAAGCQRAVSSSQGGPSRSHSSSPPPVPAATVSVVPVDAATGVFPDQPVTVTATGGTLAKVAVKDADGNAVDGGPGTAPDTWVSTGALAPATTYTVTATAVNSQGKQTDLTTFFTTLTPTKALATKIAPLPGEVVGVGMPIIVYFTAPVTDRAAIERRLHVDASIPVKGAWHWYSSTEVHYRPQQYWPVGDKVTITAAIEGVNAGKGVWGASDRTTTFTIGDSHITLVDAKTHTMDVKVNGKTVKTAPVSLGRDKYPTTSGIHVVLSKTPKVIMDSATVGIPKGNPDYYYETVLWDVRITWSGEFVHSAPWSVSDQGRVNVSHGCVNAAPDVAEWFYNLSQRGDVVNIINTPRALESGNGWTDWNMSWADWLKGSALPAGTYSAPQQTPTPPSVATASSTAKAASTATPTATPKPTATTRSVSATAAQ